jgi:nitrite reductase/ring-hydroxylating ferredoxin subunit
MGRLVKVAETKDVPPGTAKAVEAEGRKIALVHSAGAYYAIDDTCAHRGGPLSEGEVEGTVVTCPWHGASYDITTGSVLGGPAPRGVASYKVRIDGNDVKVELP